MKNKYGKWFLLLPVKLADTIAISDGSSFVFSGEIERFYPKNYLHLFFNCLKRVGKSNG